MENHRDIYLIVTIYILKFCKKEHWRFIKKKNSISGLNHRPFQTNGTQHLHLRTMTDSGTNGAQNRRPSTTTANGTNGTRNRQTTANGINGTRCRRPRRQNTANGTNGTLFRPPPSGISGTQRPPHRPRHIKSTKLPAKSI